MSSHSKRQRAYRKALAEVSTLELPQAVDKLKSLNESLPKGVKASSFDQTVELAVRLGVDPKHADQIVRGSIVLPHGIGKSQRVLVFCQGPNVALAEEAGADHVGGKDLAEGSKIKVEV